MSTWIAHSKGPWKSHKYVRKEGEGENAKYIYSELRGFSSRPKNITGDAGSSIYKRGEGLGVGSINKDNYGDSKLVSQNRLAIDQDEWFSSDNPIIDLVESEGDKLGKYLRKKFPKFFYYMDTPIYELLKK